MLFRSKYLFSTMIQCKECGWSFRRTVRTYQNTYIRWVCSGHNGKGADSCPNAVTVDEGELIRALEGYFAEILKNKKNVINHVVKEMKRAYKAKNDSRDYEKKLNIEVARLRKARQKYMDMYTDDLISRKELNEKVGGMKSEMERLENDLKLVRSHLDRDGRLETIIKETFRRIEDVASIQEMTNEQLKKIIQKMEVDKDGNIDIYLRLFRDPGWDKAF